MTSEKRHLRYRLLITMAVLVLMAPATAFALLDMATPDSDIGSLKEGTRFLGMSVSLKSAESENPSSIFQTIESTEQQTHKINAFGGYFIRDKWAVGGSLDYSFSEKSSGFTGDSDKSRVETVSRSTSMGVFMRNYLPIDSSGRFSLFVESSLDVGYGKEIVQTTLENDIDRKITRSYLVDLGVTPGIMAFIDKGFSVEASVNIMGLTSKWGEYSFNEGERTGNSSSVELDFTVKLLTLFIGVTYYF